MVSLSEEIARGVVDETRAVGILEQWLIEGKLEPEDALTQACDLLSGGLDTVSILLLFYIPLSRLYSRLQKTCLQILADDCINNSKHNIPMYSLVYTAANIRSFIQY